MHDYKHHFKEMCKNIDYSSVVFLQSTGEILGINYLLRKDNFQPVHAHLNVNYDSLGVDRSMVFCGLNLTIDKQVILCNGSVSTIDVDGDNVVVVFFDHRLSSFRDNQLPRIFWKDTQSVYRGNSDYVPYENSLSHSMVGKNDRQLFHDDFIQEYCTTDEAILKNGICFWGMIGKIKVDIYTTIVKIEKFPFYSLSNEVAGIIIAYLPINHVSDSLVVSSDHSHKIDDQFLMNTLMNADVFLAIVNFEVLEKVEYYTDNFKSLTYDIDAFLNGQVSLFDFVELTNRSTFKREFKEQIFSKKMAYNTIQKLVDSSGESFWCKLFFTPMIDSSNRVKKVAIVFEFLGTEGIVTDDYLKLMQIVNRNHMVFSVRSIYTPLEFEILTQNFNQFGYEAKEITEYGLPYLSLIGKKYQKKYTEVLDSLQKKLIDRAIIEYPIINKNHQKYWLKESIFVISINNKLYIESAIINITSTKIAYDSLKDVSDDFLKTKFNEMTPRLNYSTVIRYARIDQIINPLLKSGLSVAIYNNSDVLMLPPSVSEETHTWVMKQLIDFSVFSLADTLKTPYDNFGIFAVPIVYNESRMGTLLGYAIIDDLKSSYSHPISDQNGQLNHLSLNQYKTVKIKAKMLADQIAHALHTAAIIVLQMQSTKSFEGEINQQRINHEILLELLNIANTSTDVVDCFQKILPKIGSALKLTRASLFNKSDDQVTFSCIAEWYTPTDSSRKDIYTNVNKNETFFKNWNWEVNSTYVLNTMDEIIPPNPYRQYSKAVVGVRLIYQGVLYGCVNFVDNQTTREWTDDEIILMEDIGYILSSVIERSSSRKEILESKQQFFSTLDAIPNNIILVNRKQRSLIFANMTFKRLFHQFVNEIDPKKTTHFIDYLYSSEKENALSELYFKDIDRWLQINHAHISYSWAEHADMFTLTDVTQTKKATEVLSTIAFTDVLTGIPNRLKFERDVNASMDNRSHSDFKTFVGILNIDNFKMINNTFSYHYGDQLLKTIVEHLNRIPEIKNRIYRFGGDEFAFYFDSLLLDQVYEIVNKIMTVFESPFYVEETDTTCTVSLGVASSNEETTNSDTIIKKAMISLSDAKVSGKNKYVFYNSALKKFEEDTFLLESELKRAVDNDCEEFTLNYQPIVEAKTGRIISVEALARWHSSRFGLVSPVKFIPIAESSGLIIPLGKYFLDMACKEARKWLDYGVDIYVSVNFSVIQMLQSDLIPNILSTLQKHKLPPKQLMIEITESLAINDINKIIDILSSIKQIGVKIAMDDFGTGYSSLNHLRRLPLNLVKFDRSFIFNIEYDPYTVSFVDTISKFCHMKDMHVCCEGVETSTQKILLQSIGVDNLQGYLFGKPMTADDFLALFSNAQSE